MRKNNRQLGKQIENIRSINNRTNTKLLQAILESSPNIIIFALDCEYRYLAFNQSHKATMDALWGKEIGLGINMLDLIVRGDDRKKAKELFDRALAGEYFIDETEYGDESLARKYWQTHYAPIYDETENRIIGLTCFNLDISMQKQIEQQLRLAELSLNMITDAIYLIDDKSKIVYVNNAACETLGYSKEELIGKTPYDIDPAITMNDMKQIKETVREQSRVICFETKHQRKDGSILNVEINTYPYSQGNLRYGLSVVKDITERKKTEEKLRLLASVFTSAKEGIIITDTRANVMDINEAYMHITGYTKEEIIGQNAGFLKSGKHDLLFYKNMWEELSINKFWSGEIWNRRKNGELFVERLTISAISDSKGDIASYVGLLSDITAIKDHEFHLERMAFHDSLTGLPNRLLLVERMEQAMSLTKRLQTVMAVCYVDLDGFKPVNDMFGHSAGDEMLVETALRMQKCTRESDTISRIGGDEFVIILLDIRDSDECEHIVKKVLKSIEKPYRLKNKKNVTVTASIGITLYPQDGSDPEELLKHADQAMYLSKENGKNRYCFYDKTVEIFEEIRRK